MRTSEIIFSQYIHLKQNFREYFLILFPLILLDLFRVFSIIYIPNNFIHINFIDFIYFVLRILFGVRAAVNIHRLIILNETTDYYIPNKKTSVSLYYMLYSALIFALTFLPSLALISYFPLIIENSKGSSLLISGFLSLFALTWGLMVYPLFGLTLPATATGKNINLFDMFSKSKGFRMTLFLQLLTQAVFMTLLSFTTILLTKILPSGLFFFNAIKVILGSLVFALFISCLSKTYIIWNKSYE